MIHSYRKAFNVISIAGGNMNNEWSEKYTSQTLCGQVLVLRVVGEPGSVSKMTLGDQFYPVIRCFPLRGNNPELIHWFFDFYKNYACLLQWHEIKRGWICYQKAKKQRSDNVPNAFWNYFDGKRIKMVGRKGAVFKWV